jgi:hypothetical protein
MRGVDRLDRIPLANTATAIGKTALDEQSKTPEAAMRKRIHELVPTSYMAVGALSTAIFLQNKP